jgi:uncharacterized protein YukE
VQFNDVLKDLQNKINTIDSKWGKAKSASNALLDSLHIATNTYQIALKSPGIGLKKAGDEFAMTCSTAIKTAMPIWEKDLGWGDYLLNILKKITSCIITLGTNSNFFARKESELKKTINEIEMKLINVGYNELDLDFKNT